MTSWFDAIYLDYSIAGLVLFGLDETWDEPREFDEGYIDGVRSSVLLWVLLGMGCLVCHIQLITGHSRYPAKTSMCRLANVSVLVKWFTNLHVFSHGSCKFSCFRVVGEMEVDIDGQWLQILQIKVSVTTAQIDVQVVSIGRS